MLLLSTSFEVSNGENFLGVVQSPVASVCSASDWLRAEILSRFASSFQTETLNLLRNEGIAHI